MKTWKAFFFLSLVLLLCFTSCKSTKTETVIEYVPVEIDLTEAVAPVKALRPDNSKLEFIVDIQTVSDIVANSLTYQSAWEQWQNYAEALEDVMDHVQEVYGPKNE